MGVVVVSRKAQDTIKLSEELCTVRGHPNAVHMFECLRVAACDLW